MLSAEQLVERRQGIGGSEIGAVAGLDPYRGPMDVWMDKLDMVEPSPDTEASRWGNKLEEVIAQEYCERQYLQHHGSVMASPGSTIRSGFMIATPDFTVRRRSANPEGKPWGLEIKCRSARQAHLWGDAGTDEVPPTVWAQCSWYMAVTELDNWDVACLLGGNELRIYHLQRDRDVEAGLIEIGRRFWQEHVIAGVPPPLDGGDATRRYLQKKYPESKFGIRASTSAIEEMALELRGYRAAKKNAERHEAIVEAQLKAEIGDHEGVEGSGFRITWRSTSGGGTDWKSLALSLGAEKEQIDKFKRPGTRRLLARFFDDD